MADLTLARGGHTLGHSWRERSQKTFLRKGLRSQIKRPGLAALVGHEGRWVTLAGVMPICALHPLVDLTPKRTPSLTVTRTPRWTVSEQCEVRAFPYSLYNLVVPDPVSEETSPKNLPFILRPTARGPARRFGWWGLRATKCCSAGAAASTALLATATTRMRRRRSVCSRRRPLHR